LFLDSSNIPLLNTERKLNSPVSSPRVSPRIFVSEENIPKDLKEDVDRYNHAKAENTLPPSKMILLPEPAGEGGSPNSERRSKMILLETPPDSPKGIRLSNDQSFDPFIHPLSPRGTLMPDLTGGRKFASEVQLPKDLRDDIEKFNRLKTPPTGKRYSEGGGLRNAHSEKVQSHRMSDPSSKMVKRQHKHFTVDGHKNTLSHIKPDHGKRLAFLHLESSEERAEAERSLQQGSIKNPTPRGRSGAFSQNSVDAKKLTENIKKRSDAIKSGGPQGPIPTDLDTQKTLVLIIIVLSFVLFAFLNLLHLLFGI